jgi:EpsI family protein
VNFFVSYYASQKSGTAIHSPQVCIPGGGWEIEQIADIPFPGDGGGRLLPKQIKRLIIRRGAERQLVYYWFEIGGVGGISEYESKLHLFTNALTANRTDGGLIRFVTPIVPSQSVSAAENRLAQFLGVSASRLSTFLP